MQSKCTGKSNVKNSLKTLLFIRKPRIVNMNNSHSPIHTFHSDTVFPNQFAYVSPFERHYNVYFVGLDVTTCSCKTNVDL